ncbi:MAG: leucyl/phenylalanyl-tRNA--protein transferase, partial [Rhodothermia bacterium]|nr:leucyl/phenylalanyl-tRNA--protein transferase [Rhodothermia bacterium]
MSQFISPDLVISAYRGGVFPMADPSEPESIFWFSPDPRAVIPLTAYRVPKSVRRVVRKGKFVTTTDQKFEAVIKKCASREETWISDRLIELYLALHERGVAHSVETWCDEQLVGGLYGVAIGGAFFGESMYHDVPNASKVALADLIGRLLVSGFVLLDTQYLTAHLERFGAVEITREQYLRQL